MKKSATLLLVAALVGALATISAAAAPASRVSHEADDIDFYRRGGSKDGKEGSSSSSSGGGSHYEVTHALYQYEGNKFLQVSTPQLAIDAMYTLPKKDKATIVHLGTWKEARKFAEDVSALMKVAGPLPNHDCGISYSRRTDAPDSEYVARFDLKPKMEVRHVGPLLPPGMGVPPAPKT